ncbi:MAG: hypothetical protein L7V86_23005 [Verrucomicrobiales bacterium]|nr:hypothetical protein [Verrucomicrobiales bacterium]
MNETIALAGGVEHIQLAFHPLPFRSALQSLIDWQVSEEESSPPPTFPGSAVVP